MYYDTNFGLDICKIKLGFVQVNPKSARKMFDVRLLFHALLCMQYKPYTDIVRLLNTVHSLMINFN